MGRLMGEEGGGGGVPCRMSILGNANVECICCLLSSMSRVELKKYPCHM